MLQRILLATILSLLLHVTLGWAFTLVAGLVAGATAPRRGWLTGAVGVALGWGGLVVYSAVTAPGATDALLGILGGLFGNIPGMLVVGCTLLIGALLGALGGLIGFSAMRLLESSTASFA